MDDTIISNPVVKDRITGGNAIIDGMESYEQAKELSDKINAGALPYSMATRNFSTISPSLGASALDIMVAAGIGAFVLILSLIHICPCHCKGAFYLAGGRYRDIR